MKKIAYLVPEFPVASETFITTEIKALQKHGYTVQLICLRRSGQSCLAGDEHIARQSLAVADVTFYQALTAAVWLFLRCFFAVFKQRKGLQRICRSVAFVLQQKGVRPRSLVWQALKISWLLSRHKCQHVHAHFAWAPASNGIVAAGFLGVPMSLTCHGSDVYKTPEDLQIKLQYADFVIAVCKRMAEEFSQLAPATEVIHLPCGVDMNVFSPSILENNKRRDLNLLFLGRLSETKGVDYLIDAMSMLSEAERCHLTIAGDGPLAESLKQQVQARCLSRWVHFIGSVDRHWVAHQMNQYDAMVLPFCKTANGIMDTGPLTLKEAMACRIPVLTTDIMASGEILDPLSCWVCRHNDAESLSVALSDLIEHLRAEPMSLRHESLVLRIDRAYNKICTDFDAFHLAATLSQAFQEMRHGR